MNKKTGIIVGVIILMAISGIAIVINKNAESNKSTAQKAQISGKTKVRSEAMRYISQANYKARTGDIEGAMAACDKAVEAAPNSPMAKSCKSRIGKFRKIR